MKLTLACVGMEEAEIRFLNRSSIQRENIKEGKL